MGLPTGLPEHRSPHVHAKMPCSATLDSKRHEALLKDTPVPQRQRPKFRPATDDFSEFTNRSGLIRASHQDANNNNNSVEAATVDLWSPVLYDPNSDSVRIIPPSRRTPLGSQFRDFKDKINEKTHRLAGLLSPEKPESLPLPLRAHEIGHKTPATVSKVQISAPYSSSRLGRADWKEFDLMAPPPGRRRSCRTTQDDSSKPQAEESEDANPSQALTSQIASSIRKERHRVRSTEAAPRQDQQNEHSQLNTLKHRGQKSESSIAISRPTPIRAPPKSRSVPPGRRPCDDDDDPFPYDKLNGNDFERWESASSEVGWGQKSLEVNTQEFPCPYRRRNPVMFNIRDHEHCAKRPFANINELKQHIRTHHRKRQAAHRCPRCKKSFGSESALSDHLIVPVDEMCEPRPATSDHMVEDGITEATEKALADEVIKIQSWKEIWWLLFPQDPAVLDPEIIPVVEAIEAEQEFDDNSAELKADLCESLKRILPDQAGDGPLFQVLAGQIQLVLEQHRAKILRKCRNNVSNGDKRATADRKKTKTSRFSVATTSYGSQDRCNRRPSLHPERTRKSQWQSVPARASISPASSVYSQVSGSHYSLGSNYQPATRTNSLSSAGALHVESPRLPFRDWVHGVKHTNETVSPGQRDSGLALQCDECNSEPCQCASYADQLSAFLTPAMVTGSNLPAPHGAVSRAVEEDDFDWAAHYGGQMLSAGGLTKGSGSGLQGSFGRDRSGRESRGQGLVSARSHIVQRSQGEFI